MTNRLTHVRGRRLWASIPMLIQSLARARGGGAIPLVGGRTAFVVQPIKTNPTFLSAPIDGGGTVLMDPASTDRL